MKCCCPLNCRTALVFLLLLILSVEGLSGIWCNKPWVYPWNSTADTVPERYLKQRTFSGGATQGAVQRKFAVSVGILPYTIESTGSILAKLIPPVSSNGSVFSALTDQGTVLFDKVLLPNSGQQLEISFNLSLIPQTHAGATAVVCTLVDEQTLEVLDEQIVSLYRLYPRNNTVKVDYRSNAILAQNGTAYTQVFPFGPYIMWEGWLNESLSNLDFLASQGYTVIHPVSFYYSYIPKKENLTAYLDRCAALGMRWIMDVRVSMNDTQTKAELKDTILTYKDHPALFGWYLADEPDGQGYPAELVQAGHDIAKALDPYHPTLVVFNCLNSAAQWGVIPDIVMTDPYPIGVDCSHTNSTYGICGCDDCVGSPVDVATRLQTYYEQLTVIKPVWIVLQAFDGSRWWSRLPTPTEERLMHYLGLINQAAGFSYWVMPDLDTSITSPLYQAISTVAVEVQKLSGLLWNYPQLTYLPSANVSSSAFQLRAWRQSNSDQLVIVANALPSTTAFTLQLKGITQGTATILFEGSTNSIPVSQSQLTDTLPTYAVRVYYVQTASSGR